MQYYFGFSIMLPSVFLFWDLFIYLRLFYGNFSVNKLTFSCCRWAEISLILFLAYNIVTSVYID